MRTRMNAAKAHHTSDSRKQIAIVVKLFQIIRELLTHDNQMTIVNESFD
jgi:hypothetical protein